MTTLPRANAQRILRGSVGAVARGILRDQDGSAAIGAGVVTATVFNALGVQSGASNRATVPLSAGSYTVALSIVEAEALNVWRIDWFDAGVLRSSTTARIVGGFMFPVEDLAAMAGMSAFSVPVLRQAREWVTNLIEQQTGCRWNRSYDLDVWVSRHAVDTHVLDYRPVSVIRTATIADGSTIDVTNIDLDPVAGVLHDIVWYGLCAVGYEHGYDEPPETLRRAALIAAADVLLRGASGLSERTRSVTNDLGVVQQFSFPGLDHPTGIDFVDSAIRAHDHRVWSVG